MGIRLSLGAEEGRLVAVVVARRLGAALLGTAAGLLLAIWTGRFLASLLFGVQAFDPITYAGVALFLTLVAALASWLPARRIAGLDPSRVLRAD
jgi:putative ABC transport system permease protein